MDDFPRLMARLGQALSDLGITTIEDYAPADARRLETGGVLVQLGDERFVVPDGAARWLHAQLGRALARQTAREVA